MEQKAYTVKVDVEVDYAEHITVNVRQLNEFHGMIFELEYTLLEGNIQ